MYCPPIKPHCKVLSSNGLSKHGNNIKWEPTILSGSQLASVLARLNLSHGAVKPKQMPLNMKIIGKIIEIKIAQIVGKKHIKLVPHV